MRVPVFMCRSYVYACMSVWVTHVCMHNVYTEPLCISYVCAGMYTYTGARACLRRRRRRASIRVRTHIYHTHARTYICVYTYICVPSSPAASSVNICICASSINICMRVPSSPAASSIEPIYTYTCACTLLPVHPDGLVVAFAMGIHVHIHMHTCILHTFVAGGVEHRADHRNDEHPLDEGGDRLGRLDVALALALGEVRQLRHALPARLSDLWAYACAPRYMQTPIYASGQWRTARPLCGWRTHSGRAVLHCPEDTQWARCPPLSG